MAHRFVCCQRIFFVYLLKSEISIKEMKNKEKNYISYIKKTSCLPGHDVFGLLYSKINLLIQIMPHK